jgi:hypothetical protein
MLTKSMSHRNATHEDAPKKNDATYISKSLNKHASFEQLGGKPLGRKIPRSTVSKSLAASNYSTPPTRLNQIHEWRIEFWQKYIPLRDIRTA